jgi:hypothetical protein
MVSAIDPTKPADGVPARKADIRRNFAAAKREVEALQRVKKQDGNAYDMKFALLRRPLLMGYAEKIIKRTVSSKGIVGVPLQNVNVVKLTLTRDVVKLNLNNPAPPGRVTSVTFIVIQNSLGNHTLKWPSSVKWANGASPSVSTSPHAIDIYAMITIDGGVTWYGFVGGQAFT